MKSPDGQPPPLPPEKTVSVHRAFMYSAGMPGWGEFYAGRRLQGLLTGFLFLGGLAWFGLSFFSFAGGLMDHFMVRLEGGTHIHALNLPITSLAASFAIVYLLWLWAVIAAVDAAYSYRQRHGLPAQAGVAWAVAISWCCPGAGNVYTGSKRYGLMLFAASVIGLFVLVPAYLQLFNGLSELVRSGRLSPANPYPIIDSVHAMMVRLNFSYGKLYQSAIKLIAIGASVADLSRGPLKFDTRWVRASLPYGLSLLFLGWLCPGSGQLLQKRTTLGWSILAAYIGTLCLTGFLLGHDLIGTVAAERLEWIAVCIQWGSMLEAVLRMKKVKKDVPVTAVERG
jgi:hypothetical protein